ncbi:hypothetical protein A6I85_17295 [Prescottella equi]|nr:hypothetical protein A6I85_17295 [Prescottella equi]
MLDGTRWNTWDRMLSVGMCDCVVLENGPGEARFSGQWVALLVRPSAYDGHTAFGHQLRCPPLVAANAAGTADVASENITQLFCVLLP